MLDGIIGLVFFTVFGFANAVLILKLKKPHEILLSTAIIMAPWQGGLWLKPLNLDFRITYILLIAAFFFAAKKAVKFKYNIKYTIILPTVLFIFWAALSIIPAISANIALGGVVVLVLNYLYFSTINKSVKKIADVDYIIKSLFLGLFYTSLLALIQYKIRFFHIGFIDGRFTTFMFWRTRSVFQHANQFGMYQLIVLPIVFRQTIIMFRNKNMKLTRLYGALFIMSLFTLYTTGNRGSWVGFVFGMVTVLGMDFFRRGNRKTKKIMIRVSVIFGILLIIASVKYGQRVYDRMFKGYINIHKQADHRKELDKDAYRVIKAHPVLGVGVWNFGHYYASVIFTHNLYLLLTSEIGYPGLIFFLWIIFGFLIEGRKAMKSKNFYVSNLGSGFMATLLGLLLASYPGPDLWISYQISSHLWIIAGIVISLNRLDQKYLAMKRIKKRRQHLNKKQEIKVNSVQLVG